MPYQYWIYIATNPAHTVLYIGVTNDLQKRMWEHSNKLFKDSFTSQYNVNKLIYCEEFNEINFAIQREKQLKSWSRKKKIALIARTNPDWEGIE